MWKLKICDEMAYWWPHRLAISWSWWFYEVYRPVPSQQQWSIKWKYHISKLSILVHKYLLHRALSLIVASHFSMTVLKFMFLKWTISQPLNLNIWKWVIKNTTGKLFLRVHFIYEPRAVTMKLWEPKRKCPKAVPTHLHNRIVWSRTLKCSVKSYVAGPSTKCCFYNFFLIIHAGPHAW